MQEAVSLTSMPTSAMQKAFLFRLAAKLNPYVLKLKVFTCGDHTQEQGLR